MRKKWYIYKHNIYLKIIYMHFSTFQIITYLKITKIILEIISSFNLISIHNIKLQFCLMIFYILIHILIYES